MSCKIKDLCERIGSGGTPSRKNKSYYNLGNIKWLKTKELDDIKIYDTEEKITEEGLKKSSAKLYPKDTIVMAMYGATVGKLGIIKEEMCTNQACCNMVVDSNKCNYKFLYYSLLYNRESIINLANGAAQQNLSVGVIGDYEINLPSLEEQEKIADILSSLDDKVELNNEMNKTLEEMAQSIFKRWFVDFEFPNEDGEPYKSSGGEMVDSELGMIPKGWEVKTIGDLCEVGSSKRIFMKEYVDSGVPFYRGKEIIEKSKGNSVSTELFITKDRFEEIKEKFGVPNKNDILLTSVGTLGVAYLVDDEDFYFKDGNLTWFKNFKEEVYRYFIYKWITSSEGKKSIDAITIGSTQKALTINALKGMKLIVPSNDILSLFEGFIKSNISNIRSNNEEKNNLIDIRDSLLPKLMSGEIQI